jgi:hypothetical protein
MSNISTLSWENKLFFEWVSDCCLTPSEQYSTLSWENKLLFEWVNDCCLTPSEQYFNFIMGEQVTFWVSDCCLKPIELFFNFMMGEHSTVPSAWWLKTEGWHPYWYVFTNQKRPTGQKEKNGSRLIPSSIHIYPPPPFFRTITDSTKTKTCVNLHTIKKHKNTDIFIHTHFILNPCF